MSAPPDAAESSRARQQPEEPSDDAPQRCRWVALGTLTGGPHRDGDERHRRILSGRDLLLDLDDPPRASTLVLRANLTESYPAIFAADSSSARLLVKGGSDRTNRPEYFLCDTRARTAERLPDVPSSELGGLDLYPRRRIGLIADPDHTGHFMIAQLHPIDTTRHDSILFYSTATRRWATKQLASAPEHKRWSVHGVLAHDGLLWWVDVAYGMVVCNPFDDAPHLRLVPLPDGCALQGVEMERKSNGSRQTREFLDQRRFIRPSEGKLRYVEIRGFDYHTAAAAAEPPINPTVTMWTLVRDRNTWNWEFEYEAPFAEIWAHESYVAARLPRDKVPNLALVDPDNHGVVYFFEGMRLFGLDVRARRVVACDECVIGDPAEMEGFLSSRFVEAWVPPEPDRTLQILPRATRARQGVLNDDIQEEVLLRLPADQPELLFRCTAVCQGWRRLITAANFCRRFRKLHGDARPMFGYVFNFADAAAFTPVTPASITPSVRRLPGGGRNLYALDSRHGRVLFRKKRPWENKSPWENKCSLLVWDAVAGKKQEVRLPEMFSAPEKFSVHDWSACILCNAPDCDHIDCGGGPYNIVLVGTTYDVKYTYGFVYSSVTLAWTATAVLDATAQERCHRGDVISIRPSTVVGGCIYFRTRGTSIIRYQFDGSAAERLSFIELPNYDARGAVLVPAGGRLQFAALRKRNDERVRLRELIIDSDGAPQWIRLEQFVLPVPCIQIAGFVEEPPCLILGTKDEGTICMNMETFKWDKLPKANGDVLPIMSFYPPLPAGTPREPDEDSPEEEVSRFRMFSRSVLRRTADK